MSTRPSAVAESTGDFYGWAAIPESWLRVELVEFEIEEVTDDRLGQRAGHRHGAPP